MEDLLIAHYFPEIQTTPRYFQPKSKISSEITAQLSSAVVSLLLRRLEAGVHWSEVGWWGVLWLAGSIKDDAAFARQLDQREVLQLVKLAAGALEKESISSWRGYVRSRRGCLLVLFLEMWTTCALVGTQEDLKTHHPEWTSREVLQFLSSYTRSLYPGDVTIVDLVDVWIRFEAPLASMTNHRHTFHYIEHAVLDNPVDAMACKLDEACAWLIDIPVGTGDSLTSRTAPAFDEETRGAAKRAGEALRRLSLLRDSGGNPDSWEAIPCATCRMKLGAVDHRQHMRSVTLLITLHISQS